MTKNKKNPSRDLRGWLDLLKEKDDLRVVDEKVAPDGEMQEIGRQMTLREGQSVLFTNIEGHEDTWCSKLSIGSLNTFGKLAMAIGLPQESSKPEMVARFKGNIAKQHSTRDSRDQSPEAKRYQRGNRYRKTPGSALASKV